MGVEELQAEESTGARDGNLKGIYWATEKTKRPRIDSAGTAGFRAQALSSGLDFSLSLI